MISGLQSGTGVEAGEGAFRRGDVSGRSGSRPITAWAKPDPVSERLVVRMSMDQP